MKKGKQTTILNTHLLIVKCIHVQCGKLKGVCVCFFTHTHARTHTPHTPPSAASLENEENVLLQRHVLYSFIQPQHHQTHLYSLPV